MNNTIEKQSADTILQNTKKLVIGDKEFEVAPPSVATLIMMSAEISELPQFAVDAERVTETVLYNAKDCAKIGRVLAIGILGAKYIKTQSKRPTRRIFARFNDKVESLAEYINDNTSPQQMLDMFVEVLKTMEVAGFFGLITFLGEMNMTKPKKVTNPTAPGQ